MEIINSWEYMKKNESRGRCIWNITHKRINGWSSVLDMNCGYAPLYKYLRGTEYHGFDVDEKCIEYLRSEYPDGHWYVSDDKSFVLPSSIDVLLLLGIVNGKHPKDSKTQNDSFIRIVNSCSPSIIVIEYSKRIDVKDIIKFIVLAKYINLGYGSYDAKFPRHGYRNVMVFGK